MIRTLIFLSVLCFATRGEAQSTPKKIVFILGAVNEQFVLPTRVDNKRIDLVRFYISSIELSRGAEVAWKEQKSYHLIDFTDSASLRVVLPNNIIFDRIRFCLGIDSVTNVSGAMGGDLDPAKGMYWAWQSGYINFKMEGMSPVVPARGHDIKFHLGGYATPNATIQTIELAVKNGKDITVGFDLRMFLASVKLGEVYNIMSPGPGAVTLSAQAAKCFSTL